MSNEIGRVLRASTMGFDCGAHSAEIERQTFGAFVKSNIADNGSVYAIGLIYAVRIDDDPLVRQLVMSNNVSNSTLMDQRMNRMVPVEACVVNVGYCHMGEMIHALPPRPPLTLSLVELCTADEIYAFTQKCDFFRLVLNAAEVPSDDLLAAALRYASWSYPDNERYDYLVKCGRQIARLLNHDLRRLSHLLALIKPA